TVFLEAETTCRPFDDKFASRTLPACAEPIWVEWPTLHTRKVPSSDHERMYCSSGDSTALRTPPKWPRRQAHSDPRSAFQIRSVPSRDQESRRCPSAKKVAPRTPP